MATDRQEKIPTPRTREEVEELLNLADTLSDKLSKNTKRFIDARFKSQSFMLMSAGLLYATLAIAAYIFMGTDARSLAGSEKAFLIVGGLFGFAIASSLLFSSFRFAYTTKYERRVAELTARNARWLLETLYHTEEFNHLGNLESFRVRLVTSDLELALSEFERQASFRRGDVLYLFDVFRR